MSYSIIIAKSVQKQIKQLPDSVAQRVIQKIQGLAQEPRPVGCVKLKGYDHQYRVRVGDYRIRYEINDTELIVKLLQCKHRRDVYR
jgi:mRNA interferase RelE/StbE